MKSPFLLLFPKGNALAFFLILVLTNSCKDPVGLDVPGKPGVWVVSGSIDTTPGPYTLHVGKTAGAQSLPIPEDSANIRLVESSGSFEYYHQVSSGTYMTSGSIVGKPGLSYWVEIRLQDGSSYASTPEEIPTSSATADSSYYSFTNQTNFINGVEVETPVMNIYTDTNLNSPEGPMYIQWRIGEVYMFEPTPIRNPFTGGIPLPCFITSEPDPQRINLFSTEGLNIDHLSSVLVAVRAIDYSFLARHYFIVNTSTISEQAYTYLQHANALINSTGSFFDTPPALIKGNIYNPNNNKEVVLGYFQASNSTVSRFYTLRKDIPFPLLSYCYNPSDGLNPNAYPRECLDCLLLKNSSNTRPSWW